MIAKLAKRGASFKGAGSYYLHDKDAQSSARVVWTETVNLRTHDPERALRVMAGTAMDREAIKEAAGVKASGRSSDKVVQTYSLSWHPDEQPGKAEMLTAARESLKVLGIEDRQALIVCHNDEPHPHIHVIVNRVSPADGRLSSTSQEKLKLSRWAEDWERRHGRIFCEQRVANNAERDQGNFVKDRSSIARSTFEAARAAIEGLNDNRDAQKAAAELRADHRRKAAALAAIGRDMHEHYRTELADLGADHQRDKARLRATHRAEQEGLQAEIQQSMKQAMRDLADTQRNARQTMAWREKSLLGRLWNAYDVGQTADNTSRRIGRALWATVSRSARIDHLRQIHRDQRQALYQDLGRQADHRREELRQRQGQEIRSAYEKFQAARAATLRQYDQEQQGYRRLWAERNGARREAWRAYQARYQTLEREQWRHQRQQKNLRRLEYRTQRLTNRGRDQERDR